MAKRKIQGMLLFGIPVIHPLNIIIILNIIVFFFEILAERQMIYLFGLIPDRVMDGGFWQVFTYGFLHSTGGILPLHLLMNMYVLFFLWQYIEPVIGNAKLMLTYLAGILGGGLLVFAYSLIVSRLYGTGMLMVTPTIGASGGIFALLILFGLLYPDKELFVLFFIIKARNAAVFSLAAGIALGYMFDVPLSNVAHLGGTLAGLLGYALFVKNKEPEQPSKKSRPPEIINYLDKQTAENDELISILHNVEDKNRKIEILKTKVAAKANLCPASSYNPDDNFCRRCEWLANCELRRMDRA